MDDVIINKIDTIERCIKRVSEVSSGEKEQFQNDFDKQDAVVLNLQRAVQASIDIGTHLISIHKLGIPQRTREVFEILEQKNIINDELSKKMQNMVGFRNIAVHDYQALNIEIIRSIVEDHLDDFENFKSAILKFGTD